MNDLSETLVAVWARLRRRPGSHWMAVAAMIVCGIAAQGWLSIIGGPAAWHVAGVVAVVLGVALARTVVPLLAAALLVAEAAALQLSAVALVPIAVALLGWHVAATLLTMARPWSRMSRGVVRGFVPVVVAATTVTAISAVAASFTAGLDLPEIGAVTLTGALIVVLGGMITLWPSDEPSRVRSRH